MSTAVSNSCAPGAAKNPGDGDPNKYNKFGARVPAVVVSPWIPPGTVDHTIYDHTSIPATLEHLFKLKPLTARDADAKDVLGLLTLAAPRADCPTTLAKPPRPAAKPLGDCHGYCAGCG